MKLPATKKILREDVKDAPAWISKVIEPINSFMETVYQALNRNITLTENTATFIKEIAYKTTSTYPVEVDVSFQNELRTKAIGVILLQAIDADSYIPAAGPVYVPWFEDNGKIVIQAIPGLAASKNYVIRLLVA